MQANSLWVIFHHDIIDEKPSPQGGIFMTRIRYIRRSRNMTQTEFGSMIGLSHVQVSKYENGTLEPNLRVITDIAKAFNVSSDFILGLTDIEEPMQNSSALTDYVEFVGKNGTHQRVTIPAELSIRFRLLLEAGMPELFANKALD